MSILDYETHQEQKQLIIETIEHMDKEEYLDMLTDAQLSDITDTMVELVDMLEDELDPQTKLNTLLNYILVLWVEMVGDYGKDSKLL